MSRPRSRKSKTLPPYVMQRSGRYYFEPKGEMVERYVGIKTDGNGRLSAEEYDQAILDLVNFLEYTGEPSRLQSEAIGRGVLVFIVVFFVFALLLKKDYWRDVH